MEWLNIIVAQYKLVVTLAAIAAFPFLVRIQQKLLHKAIPGHPEQHRLYRAELLLKILLAVILLCLLLVFWGIELRGLLVLGSSLFAMLGVALFAGWSLLSNLTSFLLMLVQNDCRVGYWVKVIDGANFVEGKIIEMGLINVALENSDGHKVLYPNNLFITRPVVVYKTPPGKAKIPRRRPGPQK